MIGLILDILEMDDWHGVSEEIEIAKGKYKLPTNIKEGYKQEIRRRKWSPKQ